MEDLASLGVKLETIFYLERRPAVSLFGLPPDHDLRAPPIPEIVAKYEPLMVQGGGSCQGEIIFLFEDEKDSSRFWDKGVDWSSEPGRRLKVLPCPSALNWPAEERLGLRLPPTRRLFLDSTLDESSPSFLPTAAFAADPGHKIAWAAEASRLQSLMFLAPPLALPPPPPPLESLASPILTPSPVSTLTHMLTPLPLAPLNTESAA